MQKMKRTEFAMLMHELRACYQNTVTDEGLWLASVTMYWKKCQDLDAEAMRRAFDVAGDVHTEWMPSRGQLLALIKKHTKDLQTAAPRLTEGEPWADTEGARKCQAIVSKLSTEMGIETEHKQPDNQSDNPGE
jgi:hypothetical protein